MTRATPNRTAAQALVRAWKSMGAPRGVRRALAMGPQGHDLARAASEVLGPEELILIHPTPAAARARFRTFDGELGQLVHEEAGAFDLILVGGEIENGDLAEVRAAVGQLGALLAPDGTLAAVIDTLAAPIPGPPADAFDLLLFPHLAAAGEFGAAAGARAPLPASAWALLLGDAGIEVDVVRAEGPVLHDDLAAAHGPRLAAYDLEELERGRMNVLGRKSGGAQ